MSSPTPTPAAAIPSFYIETFDNDGNTLARERTFHQSDKLRNREIFAENIVPLGHVSLELSKSSDGEKLILVRNSMPANKSRRRSTSLSQSAANCKKLESLFEGLKLNSKLGNNQDQDYEAVIKNTPIPKVRTPKNLNDVGESQKTRRSRMDQINFIHDYYQYPQITKRRRVQSN